MVGRISVVDPLIGQSEGHNSQSPTFTRRLDFSLTSKLKPGSMMTAKHPDRIDVYAGILVPGLTEVRDAALLCWLEAHLCDSFSINGRE